ncbi:tryptophan halogenase family protein [Neptunicella sp. SCSIO 80796]|uniref:tryptophan halogenase family protein n=1 Tax=Neptunicella plasticusilytica TaxID=3117012 RepID=UPI003A4E227E
MQTITRYVIVGGGTTGWIAASILANQFRHQPVSIELIESEQIGTIGVGESTIPPFLELLRQLDIDEVDFIRKTQASFKLGIEFVDWRVKGESYFHPFGAITAGMDEYSFYQLWVKKHAQPHIGALQDFSVNSEMAKQHKFFLPQHQGQTPLTEARYALHLDASLVANYLREYAEQAGVKRIEGKITQVQQQDGHIQSVTLHNARQISGEFFIDCSGFNALLIGQSLEVDYLDWSAYLPCDRAVVAQTASTGQIIPNTRATASDAGWIWRIPLQSRVGNGYVYSSQFCSDEQAHQRLLQHLQGAPLTEPRVLHFKTGVRAKTWTGNCLSLGLAAGFIEPLESTAIHLVVRGMIHFMRNLPGMDCHSSLRSEFNRRMCMDYEEIRDFIVLHYCLTERQDTAFWQYCRQMALPDSLLHTLNYFKASGSLPEMLDPLFSPVSWRSVCEGMGVRPARHSVLVDELDTPKLDEHLRHYVESLQRFVSQLPTHGDFIKQHCESA